MSNNKKQLLGLLCTFGCIMLAVVGAVHLERFVDGPLRFTGWGILIIGVLLLILTDRKKIQFTESAIEIKPILGRKKIVPYENIKSVEYIETKISGGHGIRTKVRNIRFNLDDEKMLQYSEMQIKYRKCVKQILEAYDNGKFPGRAIKMATRERLSNSIS